MNFNLNDNSLVSGGIKVFNNGIAGVVKNVKLSVTKKTPEEQEMSPDYKVIITDDDGAFINQGFYYHKEDSNKSSEQNDKNAGYLVGRIQSVSNSVVPAGFIYPEVSNKNANEIVDILFKIINDNCEGKTVNVLATYGRKVNPSQYLGLRFFDFIESGDAVNSKLKVKGDDMIERMVADESSSKSEEKASSSPW